MSLKFSQIHKLPQPVEAYELGPYKLLSFVIAIRLTFETKLSCELNLRDEIK